MKLRIISKSGRVPAYATPGSAGMDLHAYLEAPVLLRPMERTLIPTGLFVEIPAGYEGQVRARSGLAIKKGIGLVNSIGTIDSDYRGEICIPVINFGQEDVLIEDGDRIAQFVIARYERAEIELTDQLEETERGAGGFGHTGVNG
ncbi:MAG: dUTP diphosphatase [Mogibacterium sp.]|nr:dUTP diphosphatase [Mogibacterium sp.]